MSRGDSSLVLEAGVGTPTTSIDTRKEERGSLTKSGRRFHSISIMNTSQKTGDLNSTVITRSGSGTLTTTIEAFNSAIASSQRLQQQQQNLVEDSAENSDDEEEEHDTLEMHGRYYTLLYTSHPPSS